MTDLFNEKMYSLKLGEYLEKPTANYYTQLTRVPGGWLYEKYYKFHGENHNSRSCFIPFNNEFQNRR